MKMCIYSKRYPNEKFVSYLSVPNAKFLIECEHNLTDKEYVECAIELSKACRMGLDIYESEKEYRAIFFLQSSFLDVEGSDLWKTMFSESTMFGLVSVDDFSKTILANFFRSKEETAD